MRFSDDELYIFFIKKTVNKEYSKHDITFVIFDYFLVKVNLIHYFGPNV